jgi:hypothetical protein
MTKTLVAFASVLLLSTSAAFAGDWASGFKTLDKDGNGTISQEEFEAGINKLGIDPVPTFAAIDADGSNSIDETEWATAGKMVKAFPNGCKSSSESWCPKQY